MSDSDIEIKKIAPMKPVKKPPKSPTETILKSQEKKITTKSMIHEALNELKTRKGVSSYAIKKYLETRYNVETEKVNYLIKKTLKSGVEDGSIIQVKGIGASGSFKLAPVKEKAKKPKAKKEKIIEKPTKEKLVKEKIVKEKTKAKSEKVEKKIVKKVTIEKKEGIKKVEKPKMEKKRKMKEVKEKKLKKSATGTPSKKAMIKKRKSIGSIIKPPKMKPKKA
ncbi:hypothetical protein MSG28_015167 [Choristoneura fumiferana]|uniref:Uncharacterized protein n=1 Tax=Choristoneura fumiferana TaxID=7141 RepID=A0ACC0KZQ8_CHOFU|nr:hypothetical protein MSG28_015167 [Choristoneura fumiferana]